MSIPEGYMLNGLGHLVPVEQVREHDLLRDELVRELTVEAVELSARLSRFKERALNDIAAFVELSAERYGVQLGGKKGNVTLSSFDGSLKVARTFADRITFGPEILAAKKLIDSCLRRWTEGADSNVRALVDRAFRTDKKGEIRTTNVLELLRLEIDDEEWKTAMEALKDSIETTGSAVYVRVYRRQGDADQYVAIPLDLAAVHLVDGEVGDDV